MTGQLTDHRPLGLAKATPDSKTRRIGPVAAQPIPTPSELPSEIKALIDNLLGGFNNKDSALYNSAFSGDAIVIDGISPYRWTGSNAQARWLSDAVEWLHDFGVESENLVCDKILHATVAGTYAYVVISATLFLKLKSGQSGSRPGILKLTFAKQSEEWKIGSQTWGRLT